MNSKWKFKIRNRILLLFIILSSSGWGQEAKFEISPYLNGITNLKDGLIEMGPLFYNENFEIKPFIKIPVTNKDKGIAQIDRNTNSLKLAASFTYINDMTKDTGPSRRLYITARMDWGTKKYTFYPDSTETSKTSEQKGSFSGECIVGLYKTEGESYAKQVAPEFRLKYSRNFNSDDEIGIVINNSNGISTVKNRITGAPKAYPLLSPAFAVNYYPGKGDFSYTPALYYNLKGKEGKSSPLNNVARLRLETWVFYYPKIQGTTGVKIGVSPFFSLRTNGTDDLNKLEYGGLIRLAVSTNMLGFFN